MYVKNAGRFNMYGYLLNNVKRNLATSRITIANKLDSAGSSRKVLLAP